MPINKETTKQVLVSLPEELYDDIRNSADYNLRSLSKEIIFRLIKYNELDVIKRNRPVEIKKTSTKTILVSFSKEFYYEIKNSAKNNLRSLSKEILFRLINLKTFDKL